MLTNEVLRQKVGFCHKGKAELPQFSAHNLNLYAECPFAYFCSKVLEIKKGDYDLVFDDPLAYGNLEHALMEKVFKDIQGDLLSESDESIQDAVREVASRFFKWWQRSNPRPFPLSLHASFEFIIHCIIRTVLKIVNSNERPVFFEKWESANDADGVSFHGRIDMVTRRGDEYMVIDFKRRKVPSKVEISDGSDVQIPLYVHLLESSGYKVGGARYISIEGLGTCKPVFDKL
jgi:ATP-dependent helicase/DNAse subunit B